MSTQQYIVPIVALVVGWILRALWARYAPSERSLALKAATKAVTALAKLQSSTPEAVAQAAANQAHEAALLAAFKDAAAKL